MLQCVAVSCNVLQSVAVSCSDLRCVSGPRQHLGSTFCVNVLRNKHRNKHINTPIGTPIGAHIGTHIGTHISTPIGTHIGTNIKSWHTQTVTHTKRHRTLHGTSSGELAMASVCLPKGPIYPLKSRTSVCLQKGPVSQLKRSTHLSKRPIYLQMSHTFSVWELGGVNHLLPVWWGFCSSQSSLYMLESNSAPYVLEWHSLSTF